MNIRFSADKGLGGVLIPPPDKSLTHRALMLASVSSENSEIYNPLETGDCISTKSCLESLGVRFLDEKPALEKNSGKKYTVQGVGLHGFIEPKSILNAGNSGTTIRLLSGLIAGLPIYAVMSGDASLCRRPMDRVVKPLNLMGGKIAGRENGKFAPLTFLPGDGLLNPLNYELPVSSAQVKSSLLFAGLRSRGTMVLTGKVHSRDHTERMLKAFGLPIEAGEGIVKLEPVFELPGFKFLVPGDISSAAFFIAGSLLSGRELTVKYCGINPTRTGFIRVLKRMNADITIEETGIELGEPVGIIKVKPSSLTGTVINSVEVPDCIDEIPLIAALALCAEGTTMVRGAEELKIKETDRLHAISVLIESLGGTVEILNDGFIIEGPQILSPGTVKSMGDHRIAMSGAILSTCVKGGITVEGFDAASISYPNFIEHFSTLGGSADA